MFILEVLSHLGLHQNSCLRSQRRCPMPAPSSRLSLICYPPLHLLSAKPTGHACTCFLSQNQLQDVQVQTDLSVSLIENQYGERKRNFNLSRGPQRPQAQDLGWAIASVTPGSHEIPSLKDGQSCRVFKVVSIVLKKMDMCLIIYLIPRYFHLSHT